MALMGFIFPPVWGLWSAYMNKIRTEESIRPGAKWIKWKVNVNENPQVMTRVNTF